MEELAARFYLSPSYFSRIFKEITGGNAIGCLQEFRMEKACEMLLTTSWSVSEIARQVGYSDQKYFYELFRRKTGMPPGKYRTQYRAEQQATTGTAGAGTEQLAPNGTAEQLEL